MVWTGHNEHEFDALNVVHCFAFMVMRMFRYGVMVDGERGNRPNIMAQEDLLRHTVRFCTYTALIAVTSVVKIGLQIFGCWLVGLRPLESNSGVSFINDHSVVCQFNNSES